MTNNFILVGGLSRSGTNGISSFIHLHEDVTMHNTLGSGAKGNMITKCKASKHLQFSMGVKEWIPIFDEINKKTLKEGKGKNLGIRWDEGENRYSFFKSGIEGNNLKMVYCMRDPLDIFASHVFHGFLKKENGLQEAAGKFVTKISKSLNAIEKADNYYAIYVPDGSKYLELLKYLELEPNEHQLKWMKNIPVVNRGGKRQEEYEAFNRKVHKEIKLPDALIDRYNRIAKWKL